MGREPGGSRETNDLENKERWAPRNSQGAGELVLWGYAQDDAVRGDLSQLPIVTGAECLLVARFTETELSR